MRPVIQHHPFCNIYPQKLVAGKYCDCGAEQVQRAADTMANIPHQKGCRALFLWPTSPEEAPDGSTIIARWGACNCDRSTRVAEAVAYAIEVALYAGNRMLDFPVSVPEEVIQAQRENVWKALAGEF